MPQATLTDIAARAGVSISTVSKVLNGRTDVAPGTRERIGRLLVDHGYRTASPGGIVDLIIIGRGSPWAEALISGAVEAATEAGYRIAINSVPEMRGAAGLGPVLEQIINRGTDGLLTVHRLPGKEERERLDAKGIPFVVIDPPVEPGDGVRSVGATNWQGGLAVTRHLLELGHRRIAAIGGPAGTWSARARLDGFRAALLQAGVPVEESLLRTGQFLAPDGRALALELLSLPEPPSAIVAGNDAQAFGALQALAEKGLRAPGDVSVTGFDDVSVATWSAPALTTVRQPLTAMAATAFRLLRLNGEGGTAQPEQVELTTTLVVRESTAPPAGA